MTIHRAWTVHLCVINFNSYVKLCLHSLIMYFMLIYIQYRVPDSYHRFCCCLFCHCHCCYCCRWNTGNRDTCFVAYEMSPLIWSTWFCWFQFAQSLAMVGNIHYSYANWKQRTYTYWCEAESFYYECSVR